MDSNAIHLPRQVREQVQFRLAEITRAQHTLGALQHELQSFLSSAAGIDLVNERWDLDPDEGVLRRVQEPQTDTPAPAPAGE